VLQWGLGSSYHSIVDLIIYRVDGGKEKVNKMFLVFLEIHWAAISSGWINKTVWILTWQNKTWSRHHHFNAHISIHISIHLSIHISIHIIINIHSWKDIQMLSKIRKYNNISDNFVLIKYRVANNNKIGWKKSILTDKVRPSRTV